MWLGSDRRHVLAAVADASPRPPVRLSPGPDAERGRGLALVEALSSRWGWHPASITGLRKFTWAEWHLPSESASGQLPADPDRDARLKPPMPPNAEEATMQESPRPGASRHHDVSALTTAELERARRELQASLALARPGSATSVPILAHLSAIDTELAGRPAGCGTSGKPSSLRIRPSADALDTSIPLSELR
jgi:hypothetical protein